MMQISKAILISTAFAAVLMAEPPYEQTLDRSMALTDTCLRELAVYKSGKGVDNSALINTLRAENASLLRENNRLSKLSHSNVPKKTNKKKKHAGNSTCAYKRYGQQLAAQCVGISDDDLIRRGLYRVKTVMLNVRETPSEDGFITAVAKKGEVYPYSKVSSSQGSSSEERFWIKGDMGWMIVTNGKNSSMNEILKAKAVKESGSIHKMAASKVVASKPIPAQKINPIKKEGMEKK